MIVILLKILTYLVMIGICVCFFLIISKIGKVQRVLVEKQLRVLMMFLKKGSYG